MAATLTPGLRPDTPVDTYARLEDRILARDQQGAAAVYFDLARAGRPLDELLAQTVRIHAPYTHVPFHQRLDNGLVKFVNNDHCLLSAGATLRLSRKMPAELRLLPMLQTIWYVPTGLDPWNQLLGKAPGHYTRMYKLDVTAEPPPPEVHSADAPPIYLDGSLEDQLNQWLTLVQCSQIESAYRVMLGLLENEAQRQQVLAQYVFAGLINIQDRMLFNRSYTTGHKAYRARATVELAERVGWDQAHAILYAGVPDMAVGPHWYSSYEMAANVCQLFFEGRDHDLRTNTGALTPAEQHALEQTVLHSREPAWQYQLADLLKAGKGPLQIVDVLQVAAAQLILECGAPENYSMPQHTAEYCSTLRWYFERFDHPHQVKLLFVAAGMVNTAAHNQAADPKNGPQPIRRLRTLDGWDQRRLLERLDQALLARDTDAALALADAYLKAGYDRGPLVDVLAVDSTRFGNDPHNQEIGLSLLEDYAKSTAADRDRLLLACTKHIPGYRKYGDPLEAYHHYTQAFGLPPSSPPLATPPPKPSCSKTNRRGRSGDATCTPPAPRSLSQGAGG